MPGVGNCDGPDVNGCIIWLTGLSAAGKTTVSKILQDALVNRGLQVQLLDGDEIRREICSDLGFSRKDRDTNIQRIAFLTRLLARNGVWAIAAVISPYRKARDQARQQAESEGLRFVEVFLDCPMEVVEGRDPKGLYRKARAGEIPRFTGVSDPYEKPDAPELILDCRRPPGELCKTILETIDKEK